MHGEGNISLTSVAKGRSASSNAPAANSSYCFSRSVGGPTRNLLNGLAILLEQRDRRSWISLSDICAHDLIARERHLTRVGGLHDCKSLANSRLPLVKVRSSPHVSRSCLHAVGGEPELQLPANLDPKSAGRLPNSRPLPAAGSTETSQAGTDRRRSSERHI